MKFSQSIQSGIESMALRNAVLWKFHWNVSVRKIVARMRMIGKSHSISPVSVVAVTLPSRVKKINQYVLRAKLGSGSSSSVYLGVDSRNGAKYAIKRVRLRELARTSAGVAQLEREIRLMKLFNHRNILKIREVLHLTSTDEAYLVLDYAENGSLNKFVQNGFSLPTPAVFSIIKQALHAIKYLHDSGYVHQDIKPGNILLDANGCVQLADFGIGHSFDSASMVVGSPAYQAPEALDDSYADDDESDSSSEGPQKEDIWALGVTLYQLLFLELPFVGSNLYEVVNDIRERPLQIPENCDPAIAEILRRMLTVDPRQRIGVDELLQNDLIALAPESASGLPPLPPPQLKDGEIIELEARVCGDGYSFATLPLALPRRFSYALRSRDTDQTMNFLRPTYGKTPRHSDGEDDDPVLLSNPSVPPSLADL